MTEEFLFIGGTNDGFRRPVPDRQRIVVLVKQTPLKIRFYDPAELSCDAEHYEHYRRFLIATGDYEYLVYALEGMKDHEVLIALISNYPTQEVQTLARRTRRR